MSKRKAQDLYDFVLPKLKWPRLDEPEKWTQHDMESAMMINALHLEPIRDKRPPVTRAKASRLIQALDLAHFDDHDVGLIGLAWRPGQSGFSWIGLA